MNKPKTLKVLLCPPCTDEEVTDDVRWKRVACVAVVDEHPPSIGVAIDPLAALAFDTLKALAFEGSNDAAG